MAARTRRIRTPEWSFKLRRLRLFRHASVTLREGARKVGGVHDQEAGRKLGQVQPAQPPCDRGAGARAGPSVTWRLGRLDLSQLPSGFLVMNPSDFSSALSKGHGRVAEEAKPPELETPLWRADPARARRHAAPQVTSVSERYANPLLHKVSRLFRDCELEGFLRLIRGGEKQRRRARCAPSGCSWDEQSQKPLEVRPNSGRLQAYCAERLRAVLTLYDSYSVIGINSPHLR